MFIYFGDVERFSFSIQSYVNLFIYIARGFEATKKSKLTEKKRQIRFVRDNSSNLINYVGSLSAVNQKYQ